MQEENKVELDTDDVKEEDVSIEEKPKEEKPEKVEVDLGYSDPIKQETKAKVVEEEKPQQEEKKETEDNLQEVSQNVQKRIDQLTRKMREAERREKAAIDFAKGLQKKYDTTDKKLSSVDDSYFKEFEARVDAQREQVKTALKSAIENNDTDKIMEANDKLTQLAVEKEKAKIHTAQKEEKKKQVEETPKQETQAPAQAPAPAQPASPRAQEWAKENEWFGSDKVMTSAAFGVHQDLVSQGFDSESDEYYNEINKQMRDYFPNKFASEKKPVQTVASAGRKQEGRRTVKLTRSQVAIAKKLGVPLEEYAKFVKE
jgi:hypothetical protein|tara:strand:- start:735 stop:1676 length:942 start_codon:yes stop_codon:yes gene_type:complete